MDKKEVIGCFEIISSRYEPLADRNVMECKCIYCKKITSFNIDDKVMLLYEGCSKCGAGLPDEPISGINPGSILNNNDIINKDYNRLQNIWSKLRSQHRGEVFSDWEVSYGLFRIWAEKSGYRPWKVLDRYDSSGGYNPDNCYWRLDSRNIDANREELKACNSYSNNVKYMKVLTHNIERILIELSAVKSDCEILAGSEFIENRGNLLDTMKDIEEASKFLKRCSRNMDNIQLLRTNNHRKRKEYLVRNG